MMPKTNRGLLVRRVGIFLLVKKRYRCEACYPIGGTYFILVILGQIRRRSQIPSAIITFVNHHIRLTKVEPFLVNYIIFDRWIFRSYLRLWIILWLLCELMDGSFYPVGLLIYPLRVGLNYIRLILLWVFPFNWITFTWSTLPSL